VHPVSQIITRNLEQHEPGGRALWINPEKDDAWRILAPGCGSLELFCQDYGVFSFLQQTGARAAFVAFPKLQNGAYDWIVLNLPRQKALLAMLLDCAASLLTAQGKLWLAGENRAGIKSADKLLKQHFGRVRKLDNARHCGLFEAGGRQDRAPFDPGLYREKWRLDCAGQPIDIVSYPGVFAHGRLDEGTDLLLRALADMPVRGAVLDFACGAGVIGTFIARRHAGARITLLDSSALALQACEETLAANGVDGRVLAGDGLAEVDGGFDLVVSNPPIHAGVSTDNRLGMRLLDNVNQKLRAGGRLVLVANRHLPYENWLSARFASHGQLAANENFKVLIAKK